MKKVILFPIVWSGVLAAVSSLLGVIIGGLSYPGYSHIRDTISILTEVGSPAIDVMKPYGTLSGLFLVIFSVYSFVKFKYKGTRIGSIFLFSIIFVSLIGASYPLPENIAGATTGIVIHILLALLLVVFLQGMLVSYWLSLRKNKKYIKFSKFTLLCFVISLLFTILTISLLKGGFPYLGLFERLAFWPPVIWVAVLNVVINRNTR